MNQLFHPGRRVTIGDFAEQRVEIPQACHERQRFRLSLDQLADFDALAGCVFPVDLAMNQLALVLGKHAQVPTTSESRSRSRAVKSRDFTVLTGTSSTSEISS